MKKKKIIKLYYYIIQHNKLRPIFCYIILIIHVFVFDKNFIRSYKN